MGTISGSELAGEVEAIREEALDLGAAVAEGGAPARDRAGELDDRLTELWPQVDAAPAEERAGLVREWNDARLDLLFVLSGGKAPTSLRLGHRLPKP